MSKAKQSQQPVKKQSAAQRIAQLESTQMANQQKFNVVAEELDNMRQTVISLAKRLNAVIQVSESEGKVSAESVNKVILDGNVSDLKGKVEMLVKEGLLTLDNDSEISTNSFVVGHEEDESGKVANPRIQLSVGSLPENIQKHLLGKKAGDTVKSSEEGGFLLKITEVYSINQLDVQKSFEDKEEGNEELAEASPE